jgi:coniferyl-aldehyde dehydrogenase
MKHTEITELERLFDVQNRAFIRDPYPIVEKRLARLKSVESMVLSMREDARIALEKDFAVHPHVLTDLLETAPVILRARNLQANLAEWMEPLSRELDATVHGGSKAEVLPQPLGVVGNIAPWNFPIECALIMVADMLAAGNNVIIKASEKTPATTRLLQAKIDEYFDEEVLAITVGGPEFSQKFASMPWNHLTYIGGANVGRKIMRAASENLTPVTLELGGKNPTIFFDDGLTDPHLKAFLSVKFMKSGQVCTAPDYVYVPRDRMEEFIVRSREFMTDSYPRYIGHHDVAGMIDEFNFTRVVDGINEAHTRQVRVVPLVDGEADSTTRQIPFTMIVDPPHDISLMSDEIFGPVLCVLPFDDVEDVLAEIRTRPRSLALYIATENEALAEHLSRVTSSGAFARNAYGMHGGIMSLPFGGNGASGMGCHGGYEGFMNYSHKKTVFQCASDSKVLPLRFVPYGEVTQTWADGVFTVKEETD